MCEVTDLIMLSITLAIITSAARSWLFYFLINSGKSSKERSVVMKTALLLDDIIHFQKY